MLSDRAINSIIAGAAGIVFASATRFFVVAGADLWAALVLGLATAAALVAGPAALARRRRS